MSLSPLGFTLAPLAVWFSLSTCLANWKLLNCHMSEHRCLLLTKEKRKNMLERWLRG